MSKFEDIKNTGIAALALLTLPSLSGCDSTPAPSLTPEQAKKMRANAIKDMDNGVYILPADVISIHKAESFTFPKALSEFRESHPELKIISVVPGEIKSSGSGNGAIGYYDYYVVVTEKK